MVDASRTEPPPGATATTWVGFTAMCVGMFMAILDVQVVATSLPTIQSALNIDPDQMSWIQTAYLMAEVIAIPLTGFLTRVLGMRILFVAALAIFTIASIGCAFSGSFASLIAWRVIQGFSGGTLIPAVFAAVFVLFPERQQGLATTLGGVLAVLAPTVGPIVGGWITQTYSWPWLFLINVLPGVVAAGLAARLLPRSDLQADEARKLDGISLALLAIALACLVLALKEAPQRGWGSGLVLGLLLASVTCATVFVTKTLQERHPLVDLGNFADRSFAVGCLLSFALGVGLFGSVYLMPVFLAFVREHNALEIGAIMLVTGVVQLLVAPAAVALERRTDARLLTAAGFTLFALGLGMSAFQTPETDYDGMFWPQVVRGAAIMFCLLPPTRLALGQLAPDRVPDASGVFNLMRNLGGAIGLALIDTVIFGRAPVHGASILERLQANDAATAKWIGLPPETLAGRVPGPLDAATSALAQPLLEKAALTQAINEAWALIALITIAALICLPFTRSSGSRPAE